MTLGTKRSLISFGSEKKDLGTCSTTCICVKLDEKNEKCPPPMPSYMYLIVGAFTGRMKHVSPTGTHAGHPNESSSPHHAKVWNILLPSAYTEDRK